MGGVSGRGHADWPHRMRWRGWRVGTLIIWLALGVTLAGCADAIVAPSPAPPPIATATATATAIPATPTTAPKPVRTVPCNAPVAPTRVFPAGELQHPFLLTGDAFSSCVLLRLVIPSPAGGAPQTGGKVILVNLTQQWLWAYADQHLAFATPITSGQPYLWTPEGTFQVLRKERDTTFSSPWAPGSPFYYTPEHVNYALFFREKGFFIHDAPWRRYFGPGTDVPHTNADGTEETGSHGCVNMATGAGAWLYGWADVGTTIQIVS